MQLKGAPGRAALVLGMALFAIVLIRSSVTLDELAHSPMARTMRTAWASGLPLDVAMLIGGWLVFRLWRRWMSVPAAG